MRILLLTQWFQPEPFFKGLPFALELQRRGHSVQVLTGFPNYPGGALYDGYRIRLFRKELVEGVSVIRVPLYPSHDRSSLRRVLNYLSFALSAALVGGLVAEKADVIYVYHPPASVGLPALVLSTLRGVPFVLDVQDLWPDSLAATGMIRNRLILKLVERWCGLVYRRAAKIVVQSTGFREVLVRRGVPCEKLEVVMNWCDERHLAVPPTESLFARELGLSGKFIVVFAGTMGKAQGLDTVLDAAAILARRVSTAHFVLVGAGIDVERLKKRVDEERIANVRFLPHRDVSMIGGILQLADVLLVHLRSDPLFSVTIPSKTQSYLANGKPILMAVRGDAADLVTRAGAGVVCESDDAEMLASCVEELYRMTPAERDAMGSRGRAFYQKELSLAVGSAKFEAVFREAAES